MKETSSGFFLSSPDGLFSLFLPASSVISALPIDLRIKVWIQQKIGRDVQDPGDLPEPGKIGLRAADLVVGVRRPAAVQLLRDVRLAHISVLAVIPQFFADRHGDHLSR